MMQDLDDICVLKVISEDPECPCASPRPEAAGLPVSGDTELKLKVNEHRR